MDDDPESPKDGDATTSKADSMRSRDQAKKPGVGRVTIQDYLRFGEGLRIEENETLTHVVARYLDHVGKDELNWRHRIVRALLLEAEQGNMRAVLEIWQRVEGKAGSAAAAGSEVDGTGAGALSERMIQRLLILDDDDEHGREDLPVGPRLHAAD